MYVEDNATKFFWQGIVLPVCFLRKLWVWKKIHLKFVKPWEMKNLPWDREKGSETVWHTVKPWELRGLQFQRVFYFDLPLFTQSAVTVFLFMKFYVFHKRSSDCFFRGVPCYRNFKMYSLSVLVFLFWFATF